jgi:hypothetical protein
MAMMRGRVAQFLSLLLVTGCCAHGSPPPAPAPSASASASVSASPASRPATPAPYTEPTSAEACRACHGEWAVHGIIQEPSCLCPTGDVDRRCRDGGECEGQCLADGGEREVVQAGPPARGYFVGKCSRFRTSFGCHRMIARGALKAGPANLEDPPTEVCAD